jgi:hypothetical protein
MVVVVIEFVLVRHLALFMIEFVLVRYLVLEEYISY